MNKFNDVYARIISEMTEKHLIKENDEEMPAGIEEDVEETEDETSEVEGKDNEALATEDDEIGDMDGDEGGDM